MGFFFVAVGFRTHRRCCTYPSPDYSDDQLLSYKSAGLVRQNVLRLIGLTLFLPKSEHKSN